MKPTLPRDAARTWPAVITGLGVLAILLATLWPTPAGARPAATTPPLCLLCGGQGLVDVILNVLLFLPAGIGLRSLGWSVGRTTLAGLGLSLAVELLQFAAIPGRDASLSDLIFNTAGCAAGAWLATRGRPLLRPTPAGARRLALGCGGLWIVLSLAVATLWAPHALTAAHYWGQWAHRFPDTEALRGDVLEASVNGRPAPDGPLPTAVDWRGEFSDSVVTVAVLARGLLPIATKAQVFAVTDGANGFLTQFEQRGCRVSFRARPLAARWRLSFPAVWLADVCGAARRDTVALVGTSTRSRLAIMMWKDGRASTNHLDLTVGLGWVLLAPLEAPRAWFGLLTALWIAVFALPLGYWGGASRRPAAALVVASGIVGVVFGIIPRAAGISATPGLDWSVALGCVLAAWGAAAWGRVRSRRTA